MAGTNGGLTGSIRRKLQDGKTPEEIVQELVAGGLTEVSAQRFVDRALAEHASAPPLPEAPALPDAPATGDSLDQFIQTRQAEVTTGRKPLIMSSLLMCSGVGITGISYILADAGDRYTLMWGPVAFGLLVFGGAVVKGLAHPRTFAWLAAAGALAAPLILGAALWTVAAATMPTEAELELTDIAADETPADRAEVVRLLSRLESKRSPTSQCDAATRLGNAVDEETSAAYNGLMKSFDDAPDSVKICIAGALIKLNEAPMAAAIYDGWTHGNNPELRRAAISGYGELGPDFTESGLFFLNEELKSPEWQLRFLVVESLAKMGPDAKPLLEIAAADEDRHVSAAAANALKTLQ